MKILKNEEYKKLKQRDWKLTKLELQLGGEIVDADSFIDWYNKNELKTRTRSFDRGFWAGAESGYNACLHAFVEAEIISPETAQIMQTKMKKKLELDRKAGNTTLKEDDESYE